MRSSAQSRSRYSVTARLLSIARQAVFVLLILLLLALPWIVRQHLPGPTH
jgi:hypothetical protein